MVLLYCAHTLGNLLQHCNGQYCNVCGQRFQYNNIIPIYLPAIQPVSWLCSLSHVLFTWKWDCCRNIWRKCIQCDEFTVRTTSFKYNGQHSWPGKAFNIIGEIEEEKKNSRFKK